MEISDEHLTNMYVCSKKFNGRIRFIIYVLSNETFLQLRDVKF